MKPISAWKFSEPSQRIDLQRIVRETESLNTPVELIKVSYKAPIGNVTLVLTPVANLRMLENPPRPDGYVTNGTTIDNHGLVWGFAPAPAPADAVALFVCYTSAAVEALVTQITGRSEVRVEVL